MRKLGGWLLLLGLAAPGFADVAVFSGIFSADDQVALFSIVASAPETVTIQTYGYAGGSVGGHTFNAGGFAPAGFLFDNMGDVLALTNGTCSQVGKDPVTGNCDDLFFQNTLGPGTFTLALAVYDNAPLGTDVAAGFRQAGNSGFTCAEAGVSGNFCDLTALGASRTGDYALSITTNPLAAVPEPASGILLLTGGAIIALRRRRITLN